MATNQAPLERIPQVYDWDMDMSLSGGRLVDLQPFWQSGPYEEERRHRITNCTEQGFSLQSYTSRRRAFQQCDTNGVVLKVSGDAGNTLTIRFKQPEKKTATVKLSDLLQRDVHISAQGKSLEIHRLVPMRNASTSFTITDDSPGEQVDWYYVRVRQKNEQYAWSSPVWVEKKA